MAASAHLSGSVLSGLIFQRPFYSARLGLCYMAREVESLVQQGPFPSQGSASALLHGSLGSQPSREMWASLVTQAAKHLPAMREAGFDP